MGLEGVNLEERLKSLLVQLQTESGILDRIVYKGKNQHKRCLYFQYLLKVRRDVRLLQSARLEEILNFLLQVINGNKPKQTIHLLESLKKRKHNSEKHNFQERLLGVARLLSQMVEPMVKAAIEISSLLARSFFMGFSLAILALLARLRVLVQQILLDVVSVFNMISSLSQKEHSIKLNREGLEFFREYYPTNEEFITLECVWQTDKFVLLEKVHKSETKNREGHPRIGIDIPMQSPNIKYQSMEAFLGEDELGCQRRDTVCSVDDLSGPTDTKRHKTDASTNQPININNGAEVGDCGDDEGHEGSPDRNCAKERSIVTTPKSLKLETKSGKSVAFLSVRKPTSSQTDETGFLKKVLASDRASTANDKDQFFSLLTDGFMKDGLF